jgi:hypothetical protein
MELVMDFGTRRWSFRRFFMSQSFDLNSAGFSRALLCLAVLPVAACNPQKADDASDSLAASAGQAKETPRAKLLRTIADRIAKDSSLGNGPASCAHKDFAFRVPKDKYEQDAFELRATFLKGNRGCTDTRQTRPPLVLSSGNPKLKGLSSPAELEILGVKDGPAKPGEVIVANFYHLKRFWIARIPMAAVKKENVILQLEHFKITENQVPADEKNVANALKGKSLDWLNNNIAGHTQLRLHFGSPVVKLTEQVLKKDQTEPRTFSISDIVLTSEAQGGKNQNYDPVSAANPLFFSVNKMVSLEEKYSDMVVRQGNRVEQFRVAGKSAPTPAALVENYLGMAKKNWRAMTGNTELKQDPAVYITVDFSLNNNKSRNCTTEVMTVLEAGRNRGMIEKAQSKFQDVTFQRLFPVFLPKALEKMDYIEKGAEMATMDALESKNGNPVRIKSADASLGAVRQHFLEKNQETCRIYFGNETDREKCKEWRAQLKL